MWARGDVRECWALGLWLDTWAVTVPFLVLGKMRAWHRGKGWQDEGAGHNESENSLDVHGGSGTGAQGQAAIGNEHEQG